MNENLEKKLVEDFPSLFAGRNKSLQESLMAFGCECGDGWFNIIYYMCKEIDSHLKHKEIKDYEFTQIKEKFGSLRVYDLGGDSYIDGVISMAESMSLITCEECGEPGLLHNSTGGHWLKTLCKKHAEELKYTYDKQQ